MQVREQEGQGVEASSVAGHGGGEFGGRGGVGGFGDNRCQCSGTPRLGQLDASIMLHGSNDCIMVVFHPAYVFVVIPA